MKKWINEQIQIQAGFTIIEALIVMSIFISLIGLSTINLLNAKHKSSLSTSVDTFIADLKQQQIKAMTGDTEGRANSGNYGIFLDAGKYTLFHDAYSATESTNFNIKLGDNIEFSNVTFPSSQIIFLQGSGEVSGYMSGSNTLTIKDIIDNSQKTILLNEYGVVTIPSPINIILNPSFESATIAPWIFFTTGTGSFNASPPAYAGEKSARVTLNTLGDNMQLYQKDLPLEPNTGYRLTFSAYSSTGHDMRVVLLKHVTPFTNYGLEYATGLTTSWNTFTTEFTTSGFSGNVNDARLMFYFVGYASPGDIYRIDNVSLEKISE